MTKLHKYLLFSIIGVAAFLRLYGLGENMTFHGELGHVYLELKNYIIAGEIPLIGPATSHPWLNFGPLYYWILAPIFLVFNFEPLAAAYFMVIAGIGAVWINYYYISKLINKRVGLVSSYLMAISLTFVNLSRGSMLFSLVVLVFYPLLYYLVKSIKEKGKYLFLTGLLLGTMLNFHLTAVVLIPAVMTIVLIYKSKFTKQDINYGLMGLIAPSIPILLYDSKQRFVMLTKLVLWIPYRIAGFFGIVPKNNASVQVINSNIISFYRYVADIFVINKGALPYVAFIVFLIIFILFIRDVVSDRRNNIVGMSLVIIFAWTCFGIFIHGDPPSHYYLPIYPIPIIVVSYYIDKLKKGGFLIALFILVFLAFNKIDYFYDNIINFPKHKQVGGSVPYKLQKSITQWIANDSDSRPFELARVGILDDYKDDFADNYRYLLWMKGNEPVVEGDIVVDGSRKPAIKYTIYEKSMEDLKRDGENIYWIGNVAVKREKLF